jgi:hypothetical protein
MQLIPMMLYIVLLFVLSELVEAAGIKPMSVRGLAFLGCIVGAYTCGFAFATLQ